MSSDGVFEASANRPKTERSVTALLSDLVTETGMMVRQEMALFRTEMAETMGRAGRGAAAMAVGGIFAFGGFLALLGAAALGLATVLPGWLSALIVGVVFVVLGAILLLFGTSRLGAEALKPQRTLHSLREDRIWLKEQAR